MKFSIPLLCCIFFLFTPLGTAQESSHSAAQAPRVVELPQTTTWKFGVRITGSGQTDRIQVTLPVPVAWPEQTIRIVSIDSTDNVTGAKLKELGDDASQLYFKVRRLVAGETAEATVTVEIEKLESVAPEDTSGFRFAAAPRGQLRKYLTPSPFIESNDRRIKDLAASLPLDAEAPAWDQVKTIYEWVRENIEYEFDTEIRSC
ncbi:MAG: hypothetical protein ACR2NP_09240, partial [Pirellulaceae bacterium]